jgi:hypothetical protein
MRLGMTALGELLVPLKSFKFAWKKKEGGNRVRKYLSSGEKQNRETATYSLLHIKLQVID